MAETMKKEASAEFPETHAFDKGDINIRWIPVKNLSVKWHIAQRKEVILSHAKKIAGSFDNEKFGILSVSMADDRGVHHIIDGVHRATAVKILWGEDEQVPCQILPAQDPQRCAQIFLGLNKGRRPVTTVDNFRNSVTAGDPDAININKVVKSLGYRVEQTKVDGTIAAVGALGNVYRRFGPEILRDVLQILQATWGMSADAVQGPIIQAYGEVLGNYHKVINFGRTKDVMVKRFPNPNRLMATVRAARELSGGGATEVIVKAVIDNYNRGLKVGQLK